MQEILIFSAGLILFLFSMMKLGEQVQKLFTARLREYIRYAVQTRISGLLTGTLSTILFQSSSTTMVITIGMVSAGLITFYQSLALILGADIGTVLTVQLVVWKFTDLSPLFIIVGGLMLIGGKDKAKAAGEGIFYFGMLFFGLSLATLATGPLKNHPAVIHFFQQTANPFLGLGIGILFTGLIHASVITISLLVILAQQDLISLEIALPIVFGANIGTTVTALMAGMMSGISGKRAAVSHFLFKSAGALVCMVSLPVLIDFLKTFSIGTAQQIVYGHFLFNILIVLMFIFILKPFAHLMEKAMPGLDEGLLLWPEFLDEKAISDPLKALENVRKEMEREIRLSQKMVMDSQNLIFHYDQGKRRDISYVEVMVNYLRTSITEYPRRISCQELPPELYRKLFSYTAIVDDIERIGNHAIIVANLSKDRDGRNAQFSEAAIKELQDLQRLLIQNIADAAAIIEKRDKDIIKRIHLQEKAVDKIVREARERHLIRLHKGLCQAEAGPIFIEVLIHLERISDHCENIAEYIDDLWNDA